jgi:hypothetical protein
MPAPTGSQGSAGSGLLTAETDVLPGKIAGSFGVASMLGSSVAGPTAALWVTDFLNAAYYARDRDERSLQDLRLARSILATAWHQADYRRLSARDLIGFHRAFGRDRFRADEPGARGRLTGDELLAGAERLFGTWFGAAAQDPGRRGWGVVFEDVAARDAFEPGRRLDDGALGALSPPAAPADHRHWHTYSAVPVPSAAATVAALREPRRWTDYGSAIGQFVAVRPGPLAGQTFEIEVAISIAARAPVLSRAYVTCTRVLEDGDLAAWCRLLDQSLLATGSETLALPAGAEPLIGLELTTHVGHFMGAATSNLLLFAEDGESYLRDVGCWDPLPAHLGLAYRARGSEAQRAFWGDGDPADSMLHGFAGAVANAGETRS